MKTKIGRVGVLGAIDVELLDLARPVGHALRRAEAGAHVLAVGDIAGGDLAGERRVEALVVRRIELDLVVVHEDQRTLLMLRRPDVAFRGERRRRGERRGGSKHGAAADLAAGL